LVFGSVNSARRERVPPYFAQIASLYANAAYKRHLAARGNAQRVQLEASAGEVHEQLARQARSWGVELSV